MKDTARSRESVGAGIAAALADGGIAIGRFGIEKYEDERAFRAARPYEVVAAFRNLLVTTGLQALGRLLTNQGSVTAFSNAAGHLGVGDSNTAAAVGQTDLQASTNKLRKAMESGYPLDPTNGVYTWRSVFASGDANFDWREFGVFNASSSGIMLCRAVSTQGTKASGQVWTLTYTLTLS